MLGLFVSLKKKYWRRNTIILNRNRKIKIVRQSKKMPMPAPRIGASSRAKTSDIVMKLFALWSL